MLIDQLKGIGPMKSKLISLSLLLTTFSSLSSCDSNKETNGIESSYKPITGIVIPGSLEISRGDIIIIKGNGVTSTDIVKLISVSDSSQAYDIKVEECTETQFSILLPSEVKSGKYKISIVRDGKSISLGSIEINIKANLDIPDKAGMTIKGVVYSDGEGLEGVTVSDGIEVTVTDKDGVYYLPSVKKHGYVFISLPSGYEITQNGNRPQFFQKVNAGNDIEQRNFSLIKVDNDDHIVITMADMHLANRNNDLEQFSQNFLSDVNSLIDGYVAAGKRVYGLTLGDMTWELYWHSNNFGLSEYAAYADKIKCQMFNVIGNHDNDPYIADDFLSAGPYKNILGPTYYSFNLGNSHYIVLDNVEYHNSGASEGVIGERNYTARIADEQISWLEKDLQLIEDKTAPVYVAMHIPLYNNPALTSSGEQTYSYSTRNGAELLELLSEFADVRIITGHTHIGYNMKQSANVREYNVPAICATWWWTGKNGYAGNHISKDGAPGGYGVWENSGKISNHYFKSIGYERNYQMRSYDLNKVHITAETFAPKSTQEQVDKYASGYATLSQSNEVLINVWGYGPGWNIEVKEDGKQLSVNRVYVKDPLHIISYEMFRLNAGATPTASFVSCNTAHMFKVQASTATAMLNITVTDHFGNQFTETMLRPKEFSCSMR